MSRYVRIAFPVANPRYRFSNLNWVIVFDRCNNVPGHAIVGKAASLTGHLCPCTGRVTRVSVTCHAGEVSNFKCKLAGRRKGGPAGLRGKPDGPRSTAQMVRFGRERMKLFSSR